MLRRIHKRWPRARLYGVDLSPDALEHICENWVGRKPTLCNCDGPPLAVSVDMIFTCTVRQHVTDDWALARIAEGFRRILNLGGRVVLFENVTHAKGEGGAHMREFCTRNYMGLWPELQWEDCGILMLGLERHELMIGRQSLPVRAEGQ